MTMVVTLVSLVAGVFGLGFFVFAFVEPPSSLGYIFRAPTMFYFVSETTGKIAMGLICCAVAFFAGAILPIFWG